jgi:ATP-dependent Lon protease
MSKNARDRKTNNTGSSVDDCVDDVFDLPIVDEEIILVGAAADAADLEEKLKKLPRILRVALLINQGRRDIHDRLVADVETLHPGLPLTAAFATLDDQTTALALAKELDRCAVADDVPELRHIADCVRLVSLPMQKDLASSEDYRRVTQTLMNTLARLPTDIDLENAAPPASSGLDGFTADELMVQLLEGYSEILNRGDLPAAEMQGVRNWRQTVSTIFDPIRVRSLGDLK